MIDRVAMMCMARRFMIFVLLIVATAAQDNFDLRSPSCRGGKGNGGCRRFDNELPCPSWQSGFETNNLHWKTIPEACVGFVGQYMYGNQYTEDSQAVIKEALAYANSLRLPRDGKNVWVFDVDDTSLSTLPYYARYGFGYVRALFFSFLSDNANEGPSTFFFFFF